MFKLRGGGVVGDLAGVPASQLAVLTGTARFVPPGFGLLDRPNGCWRCRTFLDAPPDRHRRPRNRRVRG